MGSYCTILLAGPQSPFWDPLSKKTTVTAWASMEDFQEGTRSHGPNASKAGVPNRDGTGAERRHILIWAPRAWRSNLATFVRADLAHEDPQLHDEVTSWQSSNQQDMAVSDRKTHWEAIRDAHGNFVKWLMCIHHPADAHAQRVRAYLTPLTLAAAGHVDFQVVRSTAQVAAYTAAYAKYVTKASFALDPTALSKGTSGEQVAYALLQQLHPAAPQMVISLMRGSFKRMSCATKEAFLPIPADWPCNQVYSKNVRCKLRRRNLCFIDWLRTFRTDVETPRPCNRVRDSCAAVGVLYASRFSPAFFGQWLCAWISADEWVLDLPPSYRCLPEDYVYFQACGALRPSHWLSQRLLVQELENEGHKPDFQAAWIAHVKGCHEVCNLILAKKLQWPPAANAPSDLPALQLSGSQQGFVAKVLTATSEIQCGDALGDIYAGEYGRKAET